MNFQTSKSMENLKNNVVVHECIVRFSHGSTHETSKSESNARKHLKQTLLDVHASDEYVEAT